MTASTRAAAAEAPARRAKPYTFAFLHVCTGWPYGIIGLVVGNRLTAAGVPVRQTAAMVAAATLAFSLEFLWAPLVDATLTRRRWYIGGAALMCGCLAVLLSAPWRPDTMSLLTALAFASCSGAALASAAIKGLMAYEVPQQRLGEASAFYTAGGYFAKAAGAAATLWMLAHVASRPIVALLSVAAAAVPALAVSLTSAAKPLPLGEFAAALRATLRDVWQFLCTRRGAATAVLCLMPFGSGVAAGLIGALAHEWHVTANELGAWIVASAFGTIAGAALAGWLSLRIGAWRAYLLLGWATAAAVTALAVAPRVPAAFLGLELLYRSLTGGCYAAILALVMTAVGRGAASTKAAIMWSLFNFGAVLPTMLEGRVHDRLGTTAMLLTDAALGLAALGVLLVVLRLLEFRFDGPGAAAAAIARGSP